MSLMKRPSMPVSPGGGLFQNEHFQVAYATNDIERSCAVFKERYGIKDFRRLEGPLKAGGYIRVELAWLGGVMYELMYAHGPGSDFVTSILPQDTSFAMRPHHLGYLVNTAAEWAAVEKEIRDSGRRILNVTDAPGFLKAYIVETPELGHHLEYIFPEPAGVAFFEAVPVS
jgi:hypothetical protein